MVKSITEEERIHGVTEAGEYDHLIGTIVPGQPFLLSAILEYLPENPHRVLELGCGTGILTEMIRGRFPRAEITGIDISPDMLRIASERPTLKTVRFVEGDLRDAWPAGPYDAVVTSLCIHHVSAEERAEVAKRAYESLSPGGHFVCGDVFRGETDWEEGIFVRTWLQWMKRSKTPEEVIQGMINARKERLPELRSITWFREILKEAGFTHVVVPFLAGFVGLVVGFKPE